MWEKRVVSDGSCLHGVAVNCCLHLISRDPFGPISLSTMISPPGRGRGADESRGDPRRMKLSLLGVLPCSWSLSLGLAPGAAQKLPAIALLKTCKCFANSVLSYSSQPLPTAPGTSVDSSQLPKSLGCLFLLNWLFTITKLKIVDPSAKEK